jgi:DNA ligase (NAD+)
VEIEIEEIKMEQKKQRMQELVELLNKASKAYYQEATEIMSNFERLNN